MTEIELSSNASQEALQAHRAADVAPPADYFAAFQRIPIPVQSIGPDGLLAQVNEAWVQFTGYAPQQAIGRSFADFLDPPSAERYRQEAVPELIELVPAQESRAVEYRLIKASREAADIVLTARPQRDPATGRFLHSLTVMTDITARNRAEAALRQAQKLEALGRLTGGVAHDFNNLLMIIQGSLQLLERRLCPADARTTRLLKAAREGAMRGAALTSRLLAFARQQELTPGPIDPRHLLDTLRPMLAHLVGAGIAIEDDLPCKLWTLRADAGQLELALLNLAANARDAMPQGGTLYLAARNATVAADNSAFSHAGGVVQPGDYVVLTLRDSGAGMDETVLARAAEPFFTTKGSGKGTGLGLSMVLGFAEQSGGALLLSSAPGAGTTAELWLPRTAQRADEPTTHERAAGGATTDAAPDTRSLRILLVDDDPLVVASTAGMLEELGPHAVTATGSAAEALVLLREDGAFDLLLTDHMMPGMTGAQLAARVRALYPSLPVVIASGYAELDGLSGDWPRLRKPYGLAELQEALNNANGPLL